MDELERSDNDSNTFGIHLNEQYAKEVTFVQDWILQM
ncbi:unnamed protein product, partial [Rotaria magnacalcarata]